MRSLATSSGFSKKSEGLLQWTITSRYLSCSSFPFSPIALSLGKNYKSINYPLFMGSSYLFFSRTFIISFTSICSKGIFELNFVNESILLFKIDVSFRIYYFWDSILEFFSLTKKLPISFQCGSRIMEHINCYMLPGDTTYNGTISSLGFVPLAC